MFLLNGINIVTHIIQEFKYIFLLIITVRQTFHLSGSFGFITGWKYPVPTCQPAVRERKGKGMSSTIRRLLLDCTHSTSTILCYTCIIRFFFLFLLYILRREPGGGSTSKAAVHFLRISRNPLRYQQQAGDYQVQFQHFFFIRIFNRKVKLNMN